MITRYAYSRPDAPAAELASTEMLRLLTDHSPDATLLVQVDASCQHATAASAWVLGRSPAELIGSNVRDLPIEADRNQLNDLFARLNSGELIATAEFRVQHAGQPAWIEVTGRRLPDASGAVLCLRDISARKQGEAVLEEANTLLRQRAATDTVTGLLNRDHLIATLEREARRAQRDHTTLAVLALGLTEFRLFTDLYGWESADAALRAVAEAIGSALHRPGDMAGRLDCDEFAVLLPSTDVEGAATVVSRILAGVSALAIPHAGTPVGHMHAVVGTAFSASGCAVVELLREAHCAMRAARGEQVGSLLPTPPGPV